MFYQHKSRMYNHVHCFSEATRQIAEIASHINEHIRQHENFQKMLTIQNSFDSSAPKILAPGRVFIKEGTLNKVPCLLITRSVPPMKEIDQCLDIPCQIFFIQSLSFDLKKGPHIYNKASHLLHVLLEKWSTWHIPILMAMIHKHYF